MQGEGGVGALDFDLNWIAMHEMTHTGVYDDDVGDRGGGGCVYCINTVQCN